jgi:uncharacterized membrane protein YdjX (TVP38/TMEM64 family)
MTGVIWILGYINIFLGPWLFVFVLVFNKIKEKFDLDEVQKDYSEQITPNGLYMILVSAVLPVIPTLLLAYIGQVNISDFLIAALILGSFLIFFIMPTLFIMWKKK